jgi:hypothetical protein
MTEQLRTAASPRLCAYLVSPGLQPTFIAWQGLWRPTLASLGVCWRSIIAATANPNMTAIPTTTRFLWALADLSAVIIAKVRTIRLTPVPSSSPKGRRCRTALIALHSKLRAYWRERRCVEEKLARGDTPDPCMAPLPPRALQNSAGVAAFWLGRPFPQTTATCVRFVTPNLRMICRT